MFDLSMINKDKVAEVVGPYATDAASCGRRFDLGADFTCIAYLLVLLVDLV